MYHQNYNPFGNAFLSTLVAAVPIAVLLYFIALHPHRDKRGVKHLGIAAPYAAFYGVLAALWKPKWGPHDWSTTSAASRAWAVCARAATSEAIP